LLKLEIISIGTSYPAWIKEALHEYQKRLGNECKLSLKEIATVKNNKKGSSQEKKIEEGKRIESFIDRSSCIIAMDQHGVEWTSEIFAEKLIAWSLNRSKFQFLIGGSEGLSSGLLERSDVVWSLSKLTLPHALARLLLLEQLYRAFMINNKHPYHR
jgi:23S rRNA (pseudouridine1915-N3)-methyltransferase